MYTKLFNGRTMVKETLFNDSIARWCSKSKKGARMIVGSIYGNFILEYKGILKPRKRKMKVFVYDDLEESVG